jgi:hypothetical protein
LRQAVNLLWECCIGYFCFLSFAFLLKASSFSLTLIDLSSASARRGFQSLFLTVFVRFSISAGSFSKASLKRVSASSSVHTSSKASSGQNSTHFASPPQRSQAAATPVSELIVIPPCGQACMHQSQPLHFFSFIIKMPVFSDWDSAFSGQAVTHLASSQDRQARAKLNIGVMRTTRIRERIGFRVFSSFSRVQAYSQIPQPVHLLGSTETNFLDGNFEAGISVTRDDLAI